MGGATKTSNQNQWQIQNQVSQNAPYAAAQPGINQSLALADRAAATTFNGPSVAALDPLVTQGQGMNEAAVAGDPIGKATAYAQNFYNRLAGQGGVSDLGLSGVGDLTAAGGYYMPYASGSMVGNNPYLDSVIAKNDAATMARINSNFSSAGRYGSPAQAGTAAGAISAADNQARLGQYNQDIQNQFAALSGLSNVGNAKAAIGQQGVGNISNYVSQLPTLAQASLFSGNTIQGIGGQNMDYAQRLIDSQNQDPWTKAKNLAEITGGLGAQFGTQTSSGTSYGQGATTQKSDPGVFGDILAGVGAGANLLKGIGGLGGFGFGQMASDLFSPPTFQGAYGSPFGGLSDIRAKEDVKELARLSNGLKLYSFSYKMGGPPQIGFMAQEVEGLYPEAVWTGDDGLKRINYEIVATRLADAFRN
jgi:hypothetical protein